jgi:GNAT superfamily N-acetyltransferase
MGMPVNAVVDMAAAAVREQHPGFSGWGFIVDDQIVGGAALYVDRDAASLNSGAVLPGYRRRGGQAALIERRVAAAREQGCRVLVAEIEKPAPGSVNPSLSNLLRHGFMPLYERTNWVWTRP